MFPRVLFGQDVVRFKCNLFHIADLAVRAMKRYPVKMRAMFVIWIA